MFAFIRRLGCLVTVLVLGVVAWMTRDLWWERVAGEPPRSRSVEWQAGTPQRAAAARARLEGLGRPSGPAYASLTAADVAALIASEGTARRTDLVRDVRAAIEGEELRVMAVVDLSRASRLEGLGPAAALLSGPRRVILAGIPSVAAGGRGLFRVTSVRIDGVQLPRPVVAAFVSQVLRRSASDSGSATISFPLPSQVADVRVAGGMMTVYKRVP